MGEGGGEEKVGGEEEEGLEMEAHLLGPPARTPASSVVAREAARRSCSKDKFYEKVINPYLLELMKHPQAIVMREGALHIRDVQGPKKTGSVKARLGAVEQEIFKCQGIWWSMD
ncbi:40S ribosomal protein S5-1 [Hordeum vulgare]|nr:40S ribosomal protein S5-1 [Hordeum vulgare]